MPRVVPLREIPGKSEIICARPIVKDFLALSFDFFLGVAAIKRNKPVIAKPSAVIARLSKTVSNIFSRKKPAIAAGIVAMIK